MADAVASSAWWSLLAGLLLMVVVSGFLRLWMVSRQAEQHDAPSEKAEAGPEPARAAIRPSRAWAAFDALTGLSTRLGLEDQLAAGVLRADARRRRLAVLYVDLDGFKLVNNSFGYGTGDALLREVGQRLLALGRSTDTVARLGGDEFLLLLDGDPDAASTTMVAERVRESLCRPYEIEGREVRLSCSVGIALYPDNGPRAQLIARADAAMTAAKRAGGNMHCFYEVEMDHDAEATIDLQRDLRAALERGEELLLHYQPKIDARNGEITGAEALIRWQHPMRGLVSPTEFIPIAERFGLIGALGQWVLEEAAGQIKAWMKMGLRMPVAINLSVHQLRQTDLVERVQEALARHKVPTDLITVEITESAAMEDAQATLRIFKRLTQAGVSLSIDDFGTGYSSLSYLCKLPATQVKVDRSFVQDLEVEADARAIVMAVIQLSHALGLEVVAEGVETVGQKDILKQMGCDQFQGYLFAKPMPASHLQHWALADESLQRARGFRPSLFYEENAPTPPKQPPGHLPPPPV